MLGFRNVALFLTGILKVAKFQNVKPKAWIAPSIDYMFITPPQSNVWLVVVICCKRIRQSPLPLSQTGVIARSAHRHSSWLVIFQYVKGLVFVPQRVSKLASPVGGFVNL